VRLSNSLLLQITAAVIHAAFSLNVRSFASYFLFLHKNHRPIENLLSKNVSFQCNDDFIFVV